MDEPITGHDVFRTVLTYWSTQWEHLLEAQNDLAFVQGRQWSDADIAKLQAENRPVVTMNRVLPIVNAVCGTQLSYDLPYRYFPRGVEDDRLARVATAQAAYIMDRNGGYYEEHKQFRLGYIMGASVLEIGHRFDHTDDVIEGDVTVTALPYDQLYYDVAASRYDRADARFMGKLMWMSVAELKRRWPDTAEAAEGWAARAPGQPFWTSLPLWQQQRLLRPDQQMVGVMQHWYKVYDTATFLIDQTAGDPLSTIQRVANGEEAEARLKAIADTAGLEASARYRVLQTPTVYEVYHTPTGTVQIFTSQEDVDRYLEMVREQAGRTARAAYQVITRQTCSLRVAHVVGEVLLDDQPSPYLDTWRYPFSWFVCYDDSPASSGIRGGVRDLKDPQREINWHHATLIDTLQHAPKGVYWVDNASIGGNPQKLEELRRSIAKAGFIGTYTGVPPRYDPPGQASPSDFAMLQLGVDHLRSISGTDYLLASPQQKTVSGRAIGARFGHGVMMLSSVLSNWRRTRLYTGMVLLSRIKQFHSPQKMLRILGQDERIQWLSGLGGPSLTRVAIEDLAAMKDLECDVIVDFQDLTPSVREQTLNRLIQLVGMGYPIPPEFLLELLDVPYKEELKAALAQRGPGPINPDILRSLGSFQSRPTGVNKE